MGILQRSVYSITNVEHEVATAGIKALLHTKLNVFILNLQ